MIACIDSSGLAVVLSLCTTVGVAVAQQSQSTAKPVKSGLTPADWEYKLADGVTRREVTYYSDDVACFAVLFLPKNHSADSKTPGVVLGQGWAGTHYSIEKYAARFAERGLVALAIDYRGWGLSSGFTTLAQPLKNDDDVRITRTKTDVIVKRTRLVPMKQVEDVRNAISYLQGEPGVDPERIGVWGSSFAGGNSIVVAALDARVKAVSVQVPASRRQGCTGGCDAAARALAGGCDQACTHGAGRRVRDRIFHAAQSGRRDQSGRGGVSAVSLSAGRGQSPGAIHRGAERAALRQPRALVRSGRSADGTEARA